MWLIILKLIEALPDLLFLIRRRVELNDKAAVRRGAQRFARAVAEGDGEAVTKMLDEVMAERRAAQ